MVRVPGPGGAGRFIPETEAASAAAAAGVELVARAADKIPQPPTPSRRLRRLLVLLGGDALTARQPCPRPPGRGDIVRGLDAIRDHDGVEMEINAQLGEFTCARTGSGFTEQRSGDARLHLALGQALLASHNEAKSTRVEGTRGRSRRGARRRYLPKNRWRQCRTGEEAGAEGIDGGGDSDESDDDGVAGVVVHCAEVKRTEHRLWMRLVGLRHDVQLWDKDRRAPALPFNSRISPCLPTRTSRRASRAPRARRGPRGVRVPSAWRIGAMDLERLDPVAAGPAAGYLDGVDCSFPCRR